MAGWANLGNAYAGLKQHDKAIAAYRKAIELDPNYALTYHNFGRSLLARGQAGRGDCRLRGGGFGSRRRTPARPTIWHGSWPHARKSGSVIPARCFELAKKAVELAPTHLTYSRTLGVAHYRMGNWRAAVEALDRSRELRGGGDSSEWFFLAMSYWRLGDKPAARKWYSQAVEWTEQHQPKYPLLRHFQAEAEQLMEGDKKEPSTPSGGG